MRAAAIRAAAALRLALPLAIHAPFAARARDLSGGRQAQYASYTGAGGGGMDGTLLSVAVSAVSTVWRALAPECVCVCVPEHKGASLSAPRLSSVLLSCFLLD
jgi:hypothetical protein